MEVEVLVEVEVLDGAYMYDCSQLCTAPPPKYNSYSPVSLLPRHCSTMNDNCRCLLRSSCISWDVCGCRSPSSIGDYKDEEVKG